MAGIINNMANLASAKLAADLTASATSVTVDDATPFASLGDFYATLMPSDEMGRASNSEIVLCSYADATTLSITRAQRGTTARAFSANDIITNGIYTQDIEQAQAVGNTIFSTTYTSSTSTYAISSNNDMLPAIPTDGMRITIIAGATSSGAPMLDLQGLGAAYNIYTGSSVNNSNVHTAPRLWRNSMYELVFNGSYWEVVNLVGGSGTGGLIGASDIADSAITTAKINGSAVTAAKLADSAVTTAKINNSAVTSAKIDWTTLGTDYFSSISFVSTVTEKSGFWIKYPNGICIFQIRLVVNAQAQASGCQIVSALPTAISPSGDFFIPGWIWWAASGTDKSVALRFRASDRGLFLYPKATVAAMNIWSFHGMYKV